MADYTLAPPPYQTLVDTAGAPVSNGCVWTYSAGTTTPIATYSDALGTVNTNQIRTDPAGRYVAYLSPGVGYKFVYEGPATPPAHGVVLRTADHIIGPPSSQAVQLGTWLPSLGGDATYSVQDGTYVRSGPLVVARGVLHVTTQGTAAGYLIQGLPFPSVGEASGLIGSCAGLAYPVVWITLWLGNADTNLVVVGLTAAGVATAAQAVLGNGASITFSVTYLTAAP
jgi:hypothetical protein